MTKSQNNWRSLWRFSSPTTLLSQSQIKEVTQNQIQKSFDCPRMKALQPLLADWLAAQSFHVFQFHCLQYPLPIHWHIKVAGQSLPNPKQLQISYLQSIIKEQSPTYFLGTQHALKFLYTNTCSMGNGAFRFLFTRYFLLIDPINFSVLYRKAEVLYGFHDCFAYRIIESHMQAKLMQQNFLFVCFVIFR